MLASQRALLGHILDYAGLFPPARLSLDQALWNYARYCGEPEAWMLARFICPVNRLGELVAYDGQFFSAQAPLRVSVLGRGGETGAAFLENLRGDLEVVRRFREECRAGVSVECFETRLPASVVEAERGSGIERFLGGVEETFAVSGLGRLPRFCELPLAGDCRRIANAVAGALAALNGEPAPRGRPGDETLPLGVAAEAHGRPAERGLAGIKLRCGGLEPAAFPTAAQVATVIEAAVGAGVALKFAAGLHHLTRRLDPGLGVCVHGCLNVFAAGILAYALGLEHDDLVAVIEEEDVRQFQFGEDIFAWNEAEATVSEIEYARQHRVISFGSCNFEEPRDELRELGLI